jgi:ribosome biogenesis GTPase
VPCSVPSTSARPRDVPPGLTELGWDDGWRLLAEPFSALDLRPARVVLQGQDAWRVHDGEGELPTTARGRLRRDDPAHLPVTGDWVLIAGDSGSAVVDRVLPRRTAMRRKVAGQRTDEQVVAANVELVAICTPADNVNLRRIERELTLVWESGASPVVVVTKCDLVPSPADVGEDVSSVALGVPVVLASSYSGTGVEQVRALLTTGRTLAVVGPSGVGKSTLGNALLQSETLATHHIREDGRGRHTTTTRQLVVLAEGGLLLDTPGMREVALWASDDGIEAAFSDIEALAATCRFHDCGHDSEPGCAVTAAVAAGSLDEDRLASWRKLQRELAYLARRQDARLRADERRKWARLNREARARSRR